MSHCEILAHWEELLQSVLDFIYSKHCGYRSRRLKCVKRSVKLWEIQNYHLPGQPLTGPCISFCFCLVMLSFCVFLKTEGFYLYFLQFRKTFSFADKTEGFLNYWSFEKASVFVKNRRLSRWNQHVTKKKGWPKFYSDRIFVIKWFKLFICF